MTFVPNNTVQTTAANFGNVITAMMSFATAVSRKRVIFASYATNTGEDPSKIS